MKKNLLVPVLCGLVAVAALIPGSAPQIRFDDPAPAAPAPAADPKTDDKPATPAEPKPDEKPAPAN